MEGIVAILAVFGMPAAIIFIRAHYRYREKELAMREKLGGALPEPAAHEAERKQLEARLQNLESIVCSVDFELNQRLNHLLSSTSVAALQMPASPAQPLGGGAAPASPPTAAAPGATLGPGATPANPFGQLTPGQVVLGRYTVARELGRGGMGAVYLADDAKLGERIALKTISPLLAGNPAALADRFRREVQAARKITHANVIRIHDLGEEGRLLFLSMEFVDGETLWNRVRRLGPLPLPEARSILDDVNAGVAAAHAAGVVHRDLKPQNVLLGGTGAQRIVKVIDFGLAKTSFRDGMTATGLILGTPEYMAPEQVRGGHVDARTDVYALGALAYSVLAGRPVFVGDTPIAVGFMHLHEAPRPLRELRPEVPASVDAAILRALEKDPAARFLDAAEFRRALAG